MEFMHNEDMPFDNQEIETARETIIKNINSHLNQAQYNGLLLLDRFLPTCSKDTLSKYGLFWITEATKIVENMHSNTQDLTLACKVLGFLIEHCKNIPKLHKHISTRNVKQILSALSALQAETKFRAVYYLIAVMLYHYPEVCDRLQCFDLTLACKVLGFLIEHCKNIPKLHKHISTRDVKQILSTLSALRAKTKFRAVYYLIAVMLYHYPEVCDRLQCFLDLLLLSNWSGLFCNIQIKSKL